ncbi:helix-turn-helix transcriptional regulator [Flavobacterium sp.]|uniref:helix-turn-helix transcriptional regulator n=1 Tax=Flavobacterium sp. TaxID=239 RepID=UPI0031E0FC68
MDVWSTKKIKPCKELEPYIHFFWELKGNLYKSQQERVYPDGCSGIIINLGNSCLTDNGSLFLEFGKTYAVGAMNSYKDSLIDMDTHLVGACLKPAAFANFYSYDPQSILINNTVEFEKSNSFHTDTVFEKSFDYFNRFYLDRLKNKNIPLQSVINDIDLANGQISIYELAKKNCTTVRQLERNFKKYIGLSPKEYSNIIRFQNALNIIKKTNQDRSLSDIAFECGYYDHSHLSNEIKRNTGLSPSSL